MSSMLRFSGFLVLLGGVTVAIHIYLYRRLIRDTTQNALLRRVGLAAIAGLYAAFLGARVLQRYVSPSSWAVPVFSATWFWMGFATYLAFSLWALGALHWLTRRLQQMRNSLAERPSDLISPERRLFLSRAVAGGAVLVSGGLTTYGAWRAYHAPQLSEVPIRLPKLPRALDGFTIVQLSDLHLSDLIGRRSLQELVRQSNALKPDLVAITGDLVDGSVNHLSNTVSALMDLRSRYGTFFVTGNHDFYSGDRPWCEALTQMGVVVLRNRYISIGDAASSFDLVGVDDWGARGRYRDRGYDLGMALQGRDPERAAVLLAHQPANFTVAADRGMGLQLSGHTHGGQFFPVTALVPLRWPRYAGLYTHAEGSLYVSRGTGFWGPPLRVGSPPEIVKITLVS